MAIPDFNPTAFFKGLHIAEFDKYKPSKGAMPTDQQVRFMGQIVQRLPHDEKMLIYFWRFLYRMDMKVIMRFAPGIEYPRGIVEVLRFAFKRHFQLYRIISDEAMAKAFEPLTRQFEILLVSEQAGICWHQPKLIEPHIIQNAIEYAEQREVRDKR